MIINLTGQSGSGKTSIAKELSKLIEKSIIIDEDDLRGILYDNESDINSRSHVIIAYNIALFLESKGFVPIISIISPYLDIRENLKRKSEVFECYIFTSESRGREIFFASNYEPPKSYFVPFDTTDDIPERIAEDIYTCFTTKHFKNIVIQKKEKPNGI